MMNGKLASFACVISASKDDLTEYWGVASEPQQALFAVQLKMGPEWSVTLATPRLKLSCLERLQLRPDEMRRLSVLP
jgi:hypothetical protein